MTTEQKTVIKESLSRLLLMWFLALLIVGPIMWLTGQSMQWDSFFIYTTLGAIFGELVSQKLR